jgi:hypothetical protein
MHVDSLVRPLEVVSAADEALDMSRAEREEYARTRDPAKIRELPGKTAVRFVCLPLSVQVSAILDARPSMSDRVVWAFALGVSEMRHADASGPAPERRMVPSQKLDIGGVKRAMWGDDELQTIQDTFGRATLYEIGGVIYERALRGKAAGGSVPFTVPQSLLDALTFLAPHRAAPPSDTPEATPST